METLDALAEADAPLGASELARLTRSERSSVFQQLRTLAEAGWVEQTNGAGYRLTLKAFSIASAALRHAGLGQRFEPTLDYLVAESGETASVAVIDGSRALVIARREPAMPMKVNIGVGTQMRLDTSASGRALTSLLDDTAVRQLESTGASVVDAEQRRRFRHQGWADQHDELLDGMSSIAIPVVVPTGEAVALSLAGPTSRFDTDRCVRLLFKRAPEIGRRVVDERDDQETRDLQGDR
jgi:DNA-binding IclR family transcriptional regulator